MLLKEPANDRLGDSVSVDTVLAAVDLLLYLGDPHVAIPFPYRLCVTDQLWG